MTLRPLAEFSAADWFVGDDDSPLPLTLGPAGFESYVRLLHAWAGDPEDSDEERREGHLDDSLLAALIEVLADHTTTANDCFFALWDGYGAIRGGESAGFLTRFAGPAKWPGRIFTNEKPPPPVPPAFPISVLEGPKLSFFHDYYLFCGQLVDAGRWGASSFGHGIRRDINSPNLMWPADRAWFVTTNIENPWTGIGGSEELIAALLADPRLEVVRQRYDIGSL